MLLSLCKIFTCDKFASGLDTSRTRHAFNLYLCIFNLQLLLLCVHVMEFNLDFWLRSYGDVIMYDLVALPNLPKMILKNCTMLKQPGVCSGVQHNKSHFSSSLTFSDDSGPAGDSTNWEPASEGSAAEAGVSVTSGLSAALTWLLFQSFHTLADSSSRQDSVFGFSAFFLNPWTTLLSSAEGFLACIPEGELCVVSEQPGTRESAAKAGACGDAGSTCGLHSGLWS